MYDEVFVLSQNFIFFSLDSFDYGFFLFFLALICFIKSNAVRGKISSGKKRIHRGTDLNIARFAILLINRAIT